MLSSQNQNKDERMICEMLVEEGLVTFEQLNACVYEQKRSGESLWSTIIKQGCASEEKVFGVLSRYWNTPYVSIRSMQIDAQVIQRVPAKYASYYKVMPVAFTNGTLVIAMSDPTNIHVLDDLKLLLSCEVKAILASEEQILEAIRKYYGVGAETVENIFSQLPAAASAGEEEKAQDLDVIAEDASITKFVNQILSEAIRARATDIHMEPYHDELQVRIRIDGMLYPVTIPETIHTLYQAMVSRIKIMAHLNIAEKRLPQDGRMKIKVADFELDLRVSVLPTPFGEGVHIRVLSQRYFLELGKLGLSTPDLGILHDVIKKPHGIIFVTGPTGSGKSTTLYASLSAINSSSVKVITIEDPIEYQMKGITQLQVNPKIGFDFAKGLRHILRHDPDVMMVGEVRDYETAEIAIRAALTGHLVFSTLHTNDACGAVTRLLDMGVEPFLVSSSLECIVAQRLLRVICPKCKTPVKNREAIVAHLGNDAKELAQAEFFEGKGCDECRFTGYYGRTGIYELLVVNDTVRDMIVNRNSSQQIKQKAVSLGMRTLREDGMQKVLAGVTTYAEVMRVTQQEAGI